MRRPAALLAAVVVVALSGCAQAQEPSPSTGSAITGTPVPLSCEQLVPSSALTGLWAGFAPGEVEPTAVSTEIAGYDGVVCGWTDSSGASFQLAVAQLDPEIIEALKNEYYTTSKAVPTYGKPPRSRATTRLRAAEESPTPSSASTGWRRRASRSWSPATPSSWSARRWTP
ncbi:hypothetical protein Q0F99_00325 [Rathayibacter oskolensis]|uniref:hypothetical protein n=1 Tax=Rathayibacter oskolensis TaxID=1891671 RepID=UPI00265F8CF5|nr:hypothetical protein [Rathayibacter oskolensis]WKK71711.1 hypothetical protein Q0F99_00325 [Rathayibacter oskolensis]